MQGVPVTLDSTVGEAAVPAVPAVPTCAAPAACAQQELSCIALVAPCVKNMVPARTGSAVSQEGEG